MIRCVVDVVGVVASVSRTVFAVLEPIDVAVVDDDSVTTAVFAIVVSTDSVSRLTVSFGAVELDVGCDGDVSCSVDAMVEEEVVDDGDDDGGAVAVVDDAFSVTNSSELCYG